MYAVYVKTFMDRTSLVKTNCDLYRIIRYFNSFVKNSGNQQTQHIYQANNFIF